MSSRNVRQAKPVLVNDLPTPNNRQGSARDFVLVHVGQCYVS